MRWLEEIIGKNFKITSIGKDLQHRKQSQELTNWSYTKLKSYFTTKENTSEETDGPANYTSKRICKLFQKLKTKIRLYKINNQLN